MGCFHYYPSTQLTVAPYSRCVPIPCDVMETDTLTRGHFDIAQHCFVADQDVEMQFHVNVLFSSPTNGAELSAWVYYNELPTVVGYANGEMAGDDVPVNQPSNVTYNVSARVTRIIKMKAGDRVWAVAGINCGGTLAGAVNGYNTVNYFEGIEIS